jgi:hypothetical protein
MSFGKWLLVVVMLKRWMLIALGLAAIAFGWWLKAQVG